MRWAWAIVVGLVLLSELALAEGTYELSGRDGSTHVELATADDAGAPDAIFNLPEQVFLFVDIIGPNEVIDFYTSETIPATNEISLRCPGRDILTDPQDWSGNVEVGQAGYLADWNEVVAVQDIATRPRAPRTYPALCGPGIYSVRLLGAAGDRVRFFDIAVRDTKGTPELSDDELRRGRVWAYYWILEQGTAAPFASEFFAVATDAIGETYEGRVWEIGLEGMSSSDRVLVQANDTGVEPEVHRRQSLPSTASPPPALRPQFPLYLNPPEKPVTAPSPNFVQFPFFNADCENLGFQFTVSQPSGFASLIIDENGDSTPDAATERLLETVVDETTVFIPWDGRLADGSLAPKQTYQVHIFLFPAEIHVPLVGADNPLGPAGPRLELVVPTAGTTDEAYHWNDEPVGGGRSPWSGDPAGHFWTAAVGPRDILNTWKRAETDGYAIIPFDFDCNAVVVPTATPTPTITPTPTPSPSPTASPSPSASPTPSNTPAPSPTPSPTPFCDTPIHADTQAFAGGGVLTFFSGTPYQVILLTKEVIHDGSGAVTLEILPCRPDDLGAGVVDASWRLTLSPEVDGFAGDVLLGYDGGDILADTDAAGLNAIAFQEAGTTMWTVSSASVNATSRTVLATDLRYNLPRPGSRQPVARSREFTVVVGTFATLAPTLPAVGVWGVVVLLLGFSLVVRQREA